jgi:hypothetical protein
MRESRTYGFVRGAHSNMRPYRDPDLFQAVSDGKVTSVTPLCRGYRLR